VPKPSPLSFFDLSEGLDILRRGISTNAFYDAEDRTRCHPGTRQGVLDVIHHWAGDSSASSVFWFTGPAGSGKSTIMQTITERCADEGILAASFTFSHRGDGTQQDGRYLFPTIAYQLATNIPQLRSAIDKAVKSEPLFSTQSLSSQFQELILKPLLDTELPQPFPKSIITIDGLDECQDVDVQRRIVETILGVRSTTFSFPFRFLFASRVVSHLQRAFDAAAARAFTYRVDLYEIFDAADDITKYLRDGFSGIRQSHPDARLPSSWPADHDIRSLVNRASGIFIYASTVLKFVGATGFHPKRRLESVIRYTGSHAFRELDRLYIQILSSHPDPENLLRILKAYVHLPRVLSKFTVPIVEGLLDFEEGEAVIILRELSSLVILTPDNDYIRLYHISFLDFLSDSGRSAQFYVGPDWSEVANWCVSSITTQGQRCV
jgi:NACHT domain